MNKIKTGVIMVVLLFLFSFNVAFAFFSDFFGGWIINTTATRIEVLEESGYDCVVPGSTIEIRSIKGPTSYFIPYYVNSKTNTVPTIGQVILGAYSGQTTITCTKQVGEVVSVVTVLLDTINLFGTSRI